MSDRVLLGTRKGFFVVSRNAAGAWAVERAAMLGDQVTMVLDRGDGRLIASLTHGHFGTKLQRSEDDGRSWAEASTPAYPPKPEGQDEVEPAGGRPVPWNLEQVWALEAGGGDRLWCGTIPGGLFRSDDAGESWSLVRSLWDHPLRKKWFGGGMDFPGIHSIVVHPDDPNDLTIGVSCGGAWRSTDGGESWRITSKGMRAEYMPEGQQFEEVFQDPHCIAQCRSVPEVLWCQHHNGIFLSRDRGEQWQEIENVSPSAFGFPVRVHPNNPERAWFIPAQKDEKRYPVDGKLVVNRTDDGGKSFQTLREGLPQEHAYDLVYRHAFDVDGSGDRLAFGSTTGSLYLSENGGDSWHLVSGTLPPILCVRWS